MELEERVAWAINFIKDRDKLNNIQLGQKLGINKNTVGEYSQGKGDMKGVALAGLAKEFGFSGAWLISGIGEPFQGAPVHSNKQYDEISENIRLHTREALMQYDPNPDALFKSDQKINIEEAMGKTYKVLNAGTALSVALYMNIQQFAAALDTGQELQECKELIKGLQSQINDLKMQVDRLSAPSTAGRQGDGSEKEAM